MLILVSGDMSSTRTAMRMSSGLTEKKLTFEGPPGTVVTSSVCPRRGDPAVGSVRDRILVSPSRKYTLVELAITGGWGTAPKATPHLPTEGAGTEGRATPGPVTANKSTSLATHGNSE